MGSPSNWLERWENFRPSKTTWFWSSVACVLATIIVGFTWGGWVTSGTATRMSAQAADQARAQMAAAYCVSSFQHAPNATAELAALKKTESWERSDFIDKGGWVKLPGLKASVDGAADLCAQQLLTATPAVKAPATG